MSPTDGMTVINPLGLAFTLFMGFLIVVLPRRYAPVPVIILTCFMTLGLRIVVLGLDFTMMRILILFGGFRIAIREGFFSLKLNVIDKVVLAWVVSGILTYIILWQTSGAFIYRLGYAYNAIGLYFLFRYLVRGLDDVQRAYRILALFMIPLALLMVMEYVTGENPYVIFGQGDAIARVREGNLRCQGPFAHPILAGTFGASAFPLLVGLWWQQGWNRLLAVLGIVSSIIIVLTSGSSTPVLAYGAGFVALSMWPLRRHMRLIRWGLFFMIIGLHVVMKAPVWWIIARVAVFGGSTGYHRAFLIDQAITRLGEWWLIGTKTTAHWGFLLVDVTNQYIRVGVDGGLVTLVLFVIIIALCFRGIGQKIRSFKIPSFPSQIWLWTMGAALFSHTAGFFSISYFDQNIVTWYLLLATISTLSAIPNLESESSGTLVPKGEGNQPNDGDRSFSVAITEQQLRSD